MYRQPPLSSIRLKIRPGHAAGTIGNEGSNPSDGAKNVFSLDGKQPAGSGLLLKKATADRRDRTLGQLLKLHLMTFTVGDAVFHVPSQQFGMIFDNGATEAVPIQDADTGQVFVQDAPPDPERVRISWAVGQTLNWVQATDVVLANDPVALQYIEQRDRRNDQLNAMFP